MAEDAATQIAVIVVAGIGAQWLAWRRQIPAIVLLLVAGFLVGPVAEIVDPDALFGDALPAVVSIGVALVLFEGSLGLSLREIRGARHVIVSLSSVGVAITWGAASAAAALLLGLRADVAVLIGAILVVTGPTVIGPLLAQIRPSGRVGPALRGEGILSDAIGATLAVLVFEAVLAREDASAATGSVVEGVVVTFGVGIGLGLLAAAVVAAVIHRYLVPDLLQSAVAIAVVLGAFTLANEVQSEAGLLTVTVAGIALASQPWAPVRSVEQFSESVGILVVSGLFIVLAARVQLSDLEGIGPEVIAFIAVLVLVVRPLAVALATIGSGLSWRERAFAAALAPRGIVAVATSSIFGLRLVEAGDPGGQQVTAVVLVVVVATIVVYGATARYTARRLGIAAESPQGALIVGAQDWARALAEALRDAGFRVVLADSRWEHVADARLAGLDAFYGSVLSERALDDLDLTGIGHLLALTPNDELNALAAQRFTPIFGSEHVFQLAPAGVSNEREELPRHLRGRFLFGPDVTYATLASRFRRGGALKSTELTEQFGFDEYADQYGDAALPLFLVRDDELHVLATDFQPAAQPGQRVLAVVAE